MSFYYNGSQLEEYGGIIYGIPGKGPTPVSEAVNIKGVAPDKDSVDMARQGGYQGTTLEQQGAENYAESQMADAPGASYSSQPYDPKGEGLQWETNPYAGTLEDPNSILPGMTDVMGNYMPNYGDAQRNLQGLEGMARDTEMTPYAQALMDEQGLQEQMAIGKQGRAATGEMQNAYSSLAQSGGLDSGARNSMTRAGMLGSMMGRQGIAGQGMGERLGIRSQDLGRKYNLLTTMPDAYNKMASTGANLYNPYMDQMGEEQQRTYDTSKYNIDSQIRDLEQKRGYDENIYGSKMDKWQTKKQLQGQARTGYAEAGNSDQASEDLYQ